MYKQEHKSNSENHLCRRNRSVKNNIKRGKYIYDYKFNGKYLLYYRKSES